jgi:Ran GTPase-activating protein (RanGAP) involved in mRNA processing and transport
MHSIYYQYNTTMVKLDLEDNGIEADGTKYLAKMLQENCYLTELVSSSDVIPK